MPKFIAGVNDGSAVSGKKRFEGVREMVITTAGYYQKGSTWKEKTQIDDMLADESNENHQQNIGVRLASGSSDVVNYISKFGKPNAKYSDWGKIYKILGLKASDTLDAAVGRKIKVLFYAGTSGYSDLWDRIYAPAVPDSQIEEEFTANLEKSEWLRKKVSPESRYALDKAPVEAVKVEADIPF